MQTVDKACVPTVCSNIFRIIGIYSIYVVYMGDKNVFNALIICTCVDIILNYYYYVYTFGKDIFISFVIIDENDL